ncbi:heavy metal-associated isoprenylated plant protein 39-like [Nymphaea colorata]|nr:heavy metal-associated isoprenylated plant protein 39-like [Nymphaea colorata]
MKLKVVMILQLHDEKQKKKVMQTVTSFDGIDRISMDMKEMKLKVVGDVDPIDLVNQLRNLCHADLLSVAPAMEEKNDKTNEESPENTPEDRPEEEEESGAEEEAGGPEKDAALVK